MNIFAAFFFDVYHIFNQSLIARYLDSFHFFALIKTGEILAQKDFAKLSQHAVLLCVPHIL